MVQVGSSVKVSFGFRIRQIDYRDESLEKQVRRQLTYKGTIIQFTPATEQDVKTLETILASDDLAQLSEISEWEVVEEGEKIMDNYMRHPNCPDFDILGVKQAAKDDDFYDGDVEDYIADNFDMYGDTELTMINSDRNIIQK